MQKKGEGPGSYVHLYVCTSDSAEIQGKTGSDYLRTFFSGQSEPDRVCEMVALSYEVQLQTMSPRLASMTECKRGDRI